MKKILIKNNTIRLVFLGIGAVLSGLVNGFLGTGGGIVLVFALGMLVADDGEDSVRDRFATVIAVIIPLSLVSALMYGNTVDFNAAVPYIIPGILGGITGGLLLDRIKVGWLKKLFAVMVIWAGICFIK